MDSRTLRDFEQRLERELRQNILPFWMQHAVDRVRGTFHGEVANDLTVNPAAPRGSLLTSRILWTFAAAARVYRDADYRNMADLAYADLCHRYVDAEQGGLYWSITADDQPLQTRKQVYAQAFGIYALTEYFRLTAEPAALRLAIDLFELIERHARDHQHGGYFEAYGRDWSPIADVRLSEVDQNDPKSQNTLLHVMEAYTNLLQVWPEARVRAALAALLEIMLSKVIQRPTHHLGLFFAADWTLRSDRISYGHDIEASWLLTAAAAALDDAGWQARVRPASLQIAEVTLLEGVDADGAVCNEGGPTGVTDRKREWWPQAEGVVGFLNAAQLQPGDPRFLTAARRAWDVIERQLIDRVHGEWYRFATPDGEPSRDEPKVSFWKCPYHNGRTCLEGTARLRSLARLAAPARTTASP